MGIQKQKIKQVIGFCCLCTFLLLLLIIKYFFREDSIVKDSLLFIKTVLLFTAIFLLIPYEYIPYLFFDNREYDKNVTLEQLVKKMRYRAVLFNNISILVFVFTIGVIIIGFWILANTANSSTKVSDITITISASIMLIFLIQIFFKLFKYLLRVASFYNGKADSIEFSNIKEDMPIDKTIDFFTPDKYDITDMQESSISGNYIDVLKAKLGIK
jgi:uncharacterized membrane protein